MPRLICATLLSGILALVTANRYTKVIMDGISGALCKNAVICSRTRSKQRHRSLRRFERPVPEGGRPRFDLYPDVSSYRPGELFDVPGLTLADGSLAKLFSSRHQGTVQRHFHLMAEHGVDGVFLMRMANECEVDGEPWSPLANLMRISDEVVDRVRNAAEAENRVWAIMCVLSHFALRFF